ncbi:hypothetical protein [Mechercharimyces sp. CAU 1602]|uniref:hypothetical protein n=1 Tax=Mechercharimyces sp. CAU 1602 TaxID=2973933 RepID=UPI00216120ED|nr:hypothetical protein [Mechercharimyces sp. CAU 1602]MCS1350080.1 hypothetical protein [Mechercharimyces sp. CAU 1602]
MATMKLSTLVLTVSPKLYKLLKKEELEAEVIVRCELSEINEEDIDEIIAHTIEFYQNSPHH